MTSLRSYRDSHASDIWRQSRHLFNLRPERKFASVEAASEIYLDSSPISTWLRRSRSRLRHQTKSTRVRNPASYAVYKIKNEAIEETVEYSPLIWGNIWERKLTIVVVWQKSRAGKVDTGNWTFPIETNCYSLCLKLSKALSSLIPLCSSRLQLIYYPDLTLFDVWPWEIWAWDSVTVFIIFALVTPLPF